MTKKEERAAVYNKLGGRCAYCGCELNGKFHIDHAEPVVRKQKYVPARWTNGPTNMEEESSNTTYEPSKWVNDGYENPENLAFENLMPACASCNIQKSSFSVEAFRANIIQFVQSLNQYSTQYKFAKRYGLVEETGLNVKFYFETFMEDEPVEP